MHRRPACLLRSQQASVSARVAETPAWDDEQKRRSRLPLLGRNQRPGPLRAAHNPGFSHELSTDPWLISRLSSDAIICPLVL